MKSIRLIHIGDVHFPESRNGLEADRKDKAFPAVLLQASAPNELQCAIRKVLNLCESESVHGILFCGDFTSRGDLGAYKDCLEYLATSLGIADPHRWSPERIHAVPGNHDVDRALRDPAGHDLFMKFSPLRAAWDGLPLPILATDHIRVSTVSDAGCTVQVYSLNSCIGCGEERTLPEPIRDGLKSLLDSYVGSASLEAAFRLIGEQLDTPAFAESHVAELVDGIQRLSNIDGEQFGCFDLLVLTSSWDRRCLCITKTESLRADHCSVLLFDKKDRSGLREKHDAILLEFAAQHSRQSDSIIGDSVKVEDLWRTLSDRLIAVRQGRTRPIRIFIDLSTCPRYYAMGLVATCLKAGIADSITVFYAEGAYPEETGEENRHELFTAGAWKTVSIPGLPGKWDPNRDRFYLVAVGFEGTKTLRLVSRAEPDRVSLLLPDPGFQPQYVSRTWDRNRELVETYHIPDSQIVRAPAGDAIAAWRALAEHPVERPGSENTYYVFCGSKPHCLALTLRALVLEYPAVLYIVPDTHKVVDIAPSGVFWRFDIQDISSLENGRRAHYDNP